MNFSTSTKRRFSRKAVASEGDFVILCAGRVDFYGVTLEKNKILDCKHGHFHHNFIIGQPFGAFVESVVSLHPEKNKTNEKNKNDKSNNNSDKSKTNEKNEKNDEKKSNLTQTQILESKKIPYHRTQVKQNKKRKSRKQKHGSVVILRPTPELWTKTLRHRTQIIYHSDISLILFGLELKPGYVVYESGTGSGSLSASISRSIAPFGKLYTFEYNETRYNGCLNDFKMLQINDLINVFNRDIIKDGYPNKNTLYDMIKKDISSNIHNQNDDKIFEKKTSEDTSKEIEMKESNNKDSLEIDVDLLNSSENLFVDAVFLDLPSPWTVIKSCNNALKYNRMICSFSPCIEQIQKTAIELKKNNFSELKTYEIISRDYIVRKFKYNNSNLPKISPKLIDIEQTMKDVKENKDNENIKDEKITGKKRSFSEISSDNNDNIMSEEEELVARLAPTSYGHTGYIIFGRKNLPVYDNSDTNDNQQIIDRYNKEKNEQNNQNKSDKTEKD